MDTYSVSLFLSVPLSAPVVLLTLGLLHLSPSMAAPTNKIYGDCVPMPPDCWCPDIDTIYYLSNEDTCEACLSCRPGFEPNMICGGIPGEERNATCEPCKSGYFSSQENQFQCDPCADCELERRDVKDECSPTNSGQCGECKQGYGTGMPDFPDICISCYGLTAEVIRLQDSCITTTESPNHELLATESLTTKKQLMGESTTNEQLFEFVTSIKIRNQPNRINFRFTLSPEQNPSTKEADKDSGIHNNPETNNHARSWIDKLSHGNITCIVISGVVIVLGLSFIIAVTLCIVYYFKLKHRKKRTKSKKASTEEETLPLQDVTPGTNQSLYTGPYDQTIPAISYSIRTISNNSNQGLLDASPVSLSETHAYRSLTSSQDQNQAIPISSDDQSVRQNFDSPPNSEVRTPCQPDSSGSNRFRDIQPMQNSATCEKAVGVDSFNADHFGSNHYPNGNPQVQEENPNQPEEQQDEHNARQSLRSDLGENKDTDPERSLVGDQNVPLSNNEVEGVQSADKQPHRKHTSGQLDLQNGKCTCSRTGTHISINGPITGNVQIIADQSQGTQGVPGLSQDTTHTIPTIVRSNAGDKVGGVPCSEASKDIAAP